MFWNIIYFYFNIFVIYLSFLWAIAQKLAFQKICNNHIVLYVLKITSFRMFLIIKNMDYCYRFSSCSFCKSNIFSLS